MPKKKETVHCAVHGDGIPCYVCNHICSQMGKGFFCADPANPLSEAWCAECEKIIEKEGEWTKRALESAYFRLVCDQCYPVIKERNRLYSVR